MNKVSVRNFIEDDWQTYRQLRLRSLQESPDSFGSTYERESKFNEQDWRFRLDCNSGSFLVLPLLAELNLSPVGLVWGVVHESTDRIAHIYQMWVSPESRRLGIGKLLLSRIIEWARGHDLQCLALSVTTTNLSAVDLYSSAGFKPCGPLEELRPESRLSVQPMKLEIGSVVA